MALSPDELQVFEGLMLGVLKKYGVATEASVDDKLRIQSDLYRQEQRASETRMTQLIKESEAGTRQQIAGTKQEIIHGIGEILDDHIHPKLDNHERRITKLETKTA